MLPLEGEVTKNLIPHPFVRKFKYTEYVRGTPFSLFEKWYVQGSQLSGEKEKVDCEA